jgi:hypothetical protein
VALRITTVTLDTNVLPAAALIQRAAAVGINATIVEVTDVEVAATSFQSQARSLPAIATTRVWSSRAWATGAWRDGAWGSPGDSSCWNKAPSILSAGGFPKTGQRQHLTEGHLRQFRDAMVLCAHIRAQRRRSRLE